MPLQKSMKELLWKNDWNKQLQFDPALIEEFHYVKSEFADRKT